MDIVLREAARLNQLVGDFLQFSRPAPLKKEPVDMAVLLGETMDVFAHDPVASGLRLSRELLKARAECDADRIRQVVWNLLLNAAQALGSAKGRITVRSGPSTGGMVFFSVEDDGPGIDPADLERIFLPFYTTKERGSGLGLANVHRAIDAHGGQITVDSTPGEGARFKVLLPEERGEGAGAVAGRELEAAG
jgi:two-component system sensor histidine kinase PilS (NtrC family)